MNPTPLYTIVEEGIYYVTSAGFEPATNGAEIRHSIQLNYEAFSERKEEREKRKELIYSLCSIFHSLLF